MPQYEVGYLGPVEVQKAGGCVSPIVWMLGPLSGHYSSFALLFVFRSRLAFGGAVEGTQSSTNRLA